MHIHVMLAVDARQVIGCAVSMRSILAHAHPSAQLHFDVMVHEVPTRDREALTRTVAESGRAASIRLHSVDIARFRHLMRSKLISHTTYARFQIGEVLGPEVERCIYLDCDMVVTRDIREAWEYPLAGRTIAAVANNPLDAPLNQARLGLTSSGYFNAGFVVIDVPRWRERQVTQRAMEFAEALGDRLILHDQDALNCALQGDWVELPREWNAGIPLADWLTEDAAAVFHYWGAPKPWHPDYAGRFGALFRRYQALTAYAEQRPWNPFGLGAWLARGRRRLPYLPAVWRALRTALSRRAS